MTSYEYCLFDPVNMIDPEGLAFSDIIPGIQKAIVDGVKGGSYAVAEAAKATGDIAMNGHPLAQTALGVAFVSEAVPAAIAGIYLAAPYAAPYAQYFASNPAGVHNFIESMAPGPPPGFSRYHIAGYAAGTLLDELLFKP